MTQRGDIAYKARLQLSKDGNTFYECFSFTSISVSKEGETFDAKVMQDGGSAVPLVLSRPNFTLDVEGWYNKKNDTAVLILEQASDQAQQIWFKYLPDVDTSTQYQEFMGSVTSFTVDHNASPELATASFSIEAITSTLQKVG